MHLKTVESLLLISLGCDGINYLRYGSFYYEEMKKLKITHNSLYLSFVSGNFVVKTSPGSFNSVAPDLKLEQSIQRTAKSVKGIIGNTKKTSYVSEWALTYHELLEITNVYWDITKSNKGGNTDTKLHHQLRNAKTIEVNTHIERLKLFFNSHGNPFFINNECEKLKNVVTQVYATKDVAEDHLNFFAKTKILYNAFQTAVYVDKTTLLSDKITKFNLLPLDHVESVTTFSGKEVKKVKRFHDWQIRHSKLQKKDMGMPMQYSSLI